MLQPTINKLLLLAVLASASVSVALPARFGPQVSGIPAARRMARIIRGEEAPKTVFGLFDENPNATGDDFPKISAIFQLMEADSLSLSPTTMAISVINPASLVAAPTKATASPGVPVPLETFPSHADEEYHHSRGSLVARWLIGSILVVVLCASIYRVWAASNTCGCCRRGRSSLEHNAEWTVIEKSVNGTRSGDRHMETKVIDIKRGFPFSRFSDYSSEGSRSVSDISLDSGVPSGFQPCFTPCPSRTASLLRPKGLFSVQSALSIVRVTYQHHARANSAPEPRKLSSGSEHDRPKSGKSLAESEWDVAQAYGAPRCEKARSMWAA